MESERTDQGTDCTSRRINFAEIYATDLLDVPGCWELCGNANCCSFSRQKDRFSLLGSNRSQELPLLPGEYDYLKSHGYLEQFGDHEHRLVDYVFGDRRLRIESIVSRRAGCACNHHSRTTVCRLYPFLPVFDAGGTLAGIERLGIYETLESLEGGQRVCKVDGMPDGERQKFLLIVALIAADPLALFYVGAYRIAQAHVRSRLMELRADREADIFTVFERAVFRGRLIDHTVLGMQLTKLAAAIEAKHGSLGLEKSRD